MSAPLDRVKLSAVLGMLGSAHEGEVLAAARQAERIRRDAGATWHEIVGPQLDDHLGGDIDKAVRALLSNADALTDWELDFVISIKHADYGLSPKQIALIDRLLRKVRRTGRAA